MIFYRRLAEISRLTRGIVVLICDIHYAKLVIDEAKRLNMLDGHFFWLWIDASKDFDVFHNINDKTQFVEDDIAEFENMKDGSEKFAKDSFVRNKRNDVDNNTVKYLTDYRPPVMVMDKISNIAVNLSKNNINNNSISPNLTNRVRTNTEMFRTHSVKSKSFSKNLSQPYDSDSHIIGESDRIVYKKGVETSKIENIFTTKDRETFSRNYSKRVSNKKMRNESFNKYVNSIHLNDTSNRNNVLIEKDISSVSNDKNLDIKENNILLSDFLMNPTVHESSGDKLRDPIEKRSEKLFTEKFRSTEESHGIKNAALIFNSLPVGLLALHPQPMKIGWYF